MYNKKEIRSNFINISEKYRNDSDTKEILAIIKEKRLKKLSGQLELVSYDSTYMKLFIARDQMDNIPSYKKLIKSGFEFHSAIKTVLSSSNYNINVNLTKYDKVKRNEKI